jgi:uncharacterized membrane protein
MRRGDPSFMAQQSGSVTVLVVILLPVLVLLSGIAIDLSAYNDQRRWVQGVADLAALSGVREMGDAAAMRAAVRATVAENRRFRTLPLADGDIVLGHVATGVFTPLTDQNAAATAEALRVVLHSPTKYLILSPFLPDENRVVARSAIASTTPRVSFSLTNCLVQTRLFQSVLRPLIGADLDVLCAGTGVRARVDLGDFLHGVALEAGLLRAAGAEATYGDILDAAIDPGILLGRSLNRPVPLGQPKVRLSDVVYMPDDLRRMRIGSPVPPIAVGREDLVLATARLLMARLVDVGLSLNLGGIEAGVRVRVGDPGQIVLGARPGDPRAVARAAQIEVVLSPVSIMETISLDLRLAVATAEARLTDQGATCARPPEAVIAVFDPVRAAILDLRLTIKALGLPVSYDTAATKSRLLNTAITARASFSRAQYEAGRVQSFGVINEAGVTTVLDALMSRAGHATDEARAAIDAQHKEETRCSGLLGCLVGGTLNLLTQTVNALLGTLTTTVAELAGSSGSRGTLTRAVLNDLLRLDVARADLRLLDVSCGQAGRLVF